MAGHSWKLLLLLSTVLYLPHSYVVQGDTVVLETNDTQQGVNTVVISGDTPNGDDGLDELQSSEATENLKDFELTTFAPENVTTEATTVEESLTSTAPVTTSATTTTITTATVSEQPLESTSPPTTAPPSKNPPSSPTTPPPPSQPPSKISHSEDTDK